MITIQFELILHDVFYETNMSADDVQFEFKKKLGCPSALFFQRQTINYFNETNSNIYIASQASDRVNHFRLFMSLIEKKIPPVLANLM